MLTAVDQFVVGVSIDTTARACHDAISQLGWRIESEHENEIALSPGSGDADPAAITVRMAALNGSTRVTLDGRVAGAGTPIQELQLKGQMRVLRRAIMRADPQAGDERAPSDLDQRAPVDPDEREALDLDARAVRSSLHPAMSSSTTLRMALVAVLGVVVLVIYIVVTKTSGGLDNSVAPPLTTKYEQVQSALQQATTTPQQINTALQQATTP
jgi:hypothetical protein